MPSDNPSSSRGILLMVLAMAAFAIADVFIKLSATKISSAHTSLLLLGGSLIIFAVLAKIERQPLLSRAALAPIMLARYCAEITATLSMVQALRLVPLSTVGAILQATPLVVVTGAVLFLGEKVSWRRWTAIIVGFLGVLMIVQPGAETFDVNVLWAVVAMLSLSARDLTTRVTPTNMASSILATYTMAAAVPFALTWVLLTESSILPVDLNGWWTAAMIGFATVGYLMIINSIRVAPVSVVSPYRYTRLLFLLILGVTVFDERPNSMMLCGAIVIIAAGLYTMWRENQFQTKTS